MLGAAAAVAGVYPGWWELGWVGGVLYRYPAQTLPGPRYSSYLALRPYPRPNEAFSRILMRFPEIGSRKGPDWPQNDLRIDLPDRVPRWSRDDPPRPSYPGPQI